jgi:hypothetical protein
MILAPKSGYIKIKCIKDHIMIDEVWGDCSVFKEKWYEAIEENNNYNVKFRGGLCPYPKSFFLTEAEIRDRKIDEII